MNRSHAAPNEYVKAGADPVIAFEVWAGSERFLALSDVIAYQELPSGVEFALALVNRDLNPIFDSHGKLIKQL